MHTLEERVAQLQLNPHPEGGFYRETYRSKEKYLPEGFSGERNSSTSVYYLLPAETFSAFHKIKSDEVWHFYEGIPLNVYVIQPNGELKIIKLGSNYANGETFQAVVPANCWFASRPVGETGYSLAGCTVAPGFDFQDFTMADRSDLLNAYPQHRQLIIELTRTQ